MKSLSRVVVSLFALVLVTGCASTKMTSTQQYEGPRIPRPERIIVYDFAATPADILVGSAIKDQYAQPTIPPSAEELEAGRTLGATVAQELVKEILGMGLTAVRAADSPPPRVGDIVIMGYFISVDTGSTTKRLLLGFGSGAANLQTEVEGYLMTDRGLRRLGSGTDMK